jgi:hypothetical protein
VPEFGTKDLRETLPNEKRPVNSNSLCGTVDAVITLGNGKTRLVGVHPCCFFVPLASLSRLVPLSASAILKLVWATEQPMSNKKPHHLHAIDWTPALFKTNDWNGERVTSNHTAGGP